MTKSYFEFLLNQSLEYLNSSAVSIDDFNFLIDNCEKDIKKIKFEDD